MRVQTNYLKVFKTRTKVPSLIYLETVSKKDSESNELQWEKDILYQQIFHKIKMQNELNIQSVKILLFYNSRTMGKLKKWINPKFNYQLFKENQLLKINKIMLRIKMIKIQEELHLYLQKEEKNSGFINKLL